MHIVWARAIPRSSILPELKSTQDSIACDDGWGGPRRYEMCQGGTRDTDEDDAERGRKTVDPGKADEQEEYQQRSEGTGHEVQKSIRHLWVYTLARARGRHIATLRYPSDLHNQRPGRPTRALGPLHPPLRALVSTARGVAMVSDPRTASRDQQDSRR